MVTTNNTTTQVVLVSSASSIINDIYAAAILQLICGGFCASTNLLVILVIGLARSMRSKCHIIMANLAMADMLLGVSFIYTGAIRINIAVNNLPSAHSQVHCVGETLTLFLSIDGSQVFTFLVGLDRFLAIMFPIWYRHTSSTYTTLAISVIAWLYVLVNAAFLFYNASPTLVISACTVSGTPTDGYYLWSTIEALTLISATLVLYGAVIMILKCKTNHMTDEIEIKITKSLQIIILIYVTLSFSSKIGFAAINYLPAQERSRLGPYLRLLQIFNGAINFFVYIWKDSSFRKAFCRHVLRYVGENTVHSTIKSTINSHMNDDRTKQQQGNIEPTMANHGHLTAAKVITCKNRSSIVQTIVL